MMSDSYFAFSPDHGFEIYATEDEARRVANDEIQGYRDSADDEGWSEDVSLTCWGIVLEKAMPEPEEADPTSFNVFVEYQLQPLESELASLRDEIEGRQKADNDIYNTLAKALGYPLCPGPSDDGTPLEGETDYCAGDHVTESLADEAARTIRELREENDLLKSLSDADGLDLARAISGIRETNRDMKRRIEIATEELEESRDKLKAAEKEIERLKRERDDPDEKLLTQIEQLKEHAEKLEDECSELSEEREDIARSLFFQCADDADDLAREVSKTMRRAEDAERLIELMGRSYVDHPQEDSMWITRVEDEPGSPQGWHLRRGLPQSEGGGCVMVSFLGSAIVPIMTDEARKALNGEVK